MSSDFREPPAPPVCCSRSQTPHVPNCRANPERPRLTEEYVNRFRDAKQQAVTGASISAMSDQIGLQYAFLAAKVHGIDLNLSQVGDRVVFEAHINADVERRRSEGAQGPDQSRVQEAAEFPPNLHIYCLDDSSSARRLLIHGIACPRPVTCAQSVREGAGRLSNWLEEPFL